MTALHEVPRPHPPSPTRDPEAGRELPRCALVAIVDATMARSRCAFLTDGRNHRPARRPAATSAVERGMP